jgi:hypothetical protein
MATAGNPFVRISSNDVVHEKVNPEGWMSRQAGNLLTHNKKDISLPTKQFKKAEFYPKTLNTCDRKQQCNPR